MSSQNRKNLRSVTRHADILHGRPGFRLRSQWGYVSVLQGGGHICELISHKHGDVNPLWNPTWKTIDPSLYTTKHRRIYGPPPEGKLLAGIAGHSISFDFFGPPSCEEIAAGHSTHGEAPVSTWRRKSGSNSSRPALTCEVTLPQAQMHLQRTLSVDSTTPVVYCEEIASNLSTFDRPISWNHHVTFGPPFLEPGVTLFDAPATHSKVCPVSFSKELRLKPDCEFIWPNAPKHGGGSLDLRTSGPGHYGHYTAHLLDPTKEVAFIAACNPRFRLLVLYIFSRRDYPWIGNWEESYSRMHTPWKGREFCRGFEFSTTPFPVPRREAVTKGNLFEESTYRWLPARTSAKSKYLIAMLDVPPDFTGVAAIDVRPGAIRLKERFRQRTIDVRMKRFF